jgi:hypothetical protein
MGLRRIVLDECDDLAGHDHEFVEAYEIGPKRRTNPGAGRIGLLSLDRDGLVEIAKLENGDLTAAVTPNDGKNWRNMARAPCRRTDWRDAQYV